ncbi:unnamed protein product [Linum trigynum]|uniref:Gnk2-homologous domain-containing protein n=1 Tax=Linum trigynum TaxID=586398 RepID=A0AAV2CLA4_9ROSI
MGLQIRRLGARMATVLMSSLILTTILGGFHGGVMIIFSAEAALDPLCGASHEWFCSPTSRYISPDAHEEISYQLKSKLDCLPFYNDKFPSEETVPDGYVHSSCANKNDRDCADCLERATQLIHEHCDGKGGGQYGTEQCCARYEMNKFC